MSGVQLTGVQLGIVQQLVAMYGDDVKPADLGKVRTLHSSSFCLPNSVFLHCDHGLDV